MVHFSRIQKIVIDAPPEVHEQELSFWASVTGRPLEPFARFPNFSGTSLGDHAWWLLVQRLTDGVPGIHLDIHTDDLEAEVERLLALGARAVDVADLPWRVLKDPAGMPFCVVPAEPGSLHDGNARRWP